MDSEFFNSSDNEPIFGLGCSTSHNVFTLEKTFFKIEVKSPFKLKTLMDF